jgi:hypothetical protein
MYSVSESVIGFFAPVKWSPAHDSLVAENGCGGKSGSVYVLRSVALVLSMVAVFGLSPILCGEAAFMAVSIQVVSVIIAIAGLLSCVVAKATESL